MTLKDDLTKTEKGLQAWHQTRSIHETTDLICLIMNKEGISKSELAEKLGKTKGFVSQLLDGSANMTLKTVSDVFLKLGYEFRPGCAPLGSEKMQLLIEHKPDNAVIQPSKTNIQFALMIHVTAPNPKGIASLAAPVQSRLGMSFPMPSDVLTCQKQGAPFIGS